MSKAKKIVNVLGRDKGYWATKIQDKNDGFLTVTCETKDGEEYEIVINKSQITTIQDAPNSTAD